MDFMLGLPATRKQYESTWIVVDRLTKSVHFIPDKSTYLAIIMQGSSYMKLCVAMGLFRYSSYRIGVHNSYLGFGYHSKKG